MKNYDYLFFTFTFTWSYYFFSIIYRLSHMDGCFKSCGFFFFLKSFKNCGLIYGTTTLHSKWFVSFNILIPFNTNFFLPLSLFSFSYLARTTILVIKTNHPHTFIISTSKYASCNLYSPVLHEHACTWG